VGQRCEVLGKEYAKVLSVNELQRKGTGKQHFLPTTRIRKAATKPGTRTRGVPINGTNEPPRGKRA
jgi:hypothetical protein